MEIFRCDRCNKVIERSERFIGRTNGMMADLCPVCYKEFQKDEEIVESHYKKQIRAICIKYGFTTIKEMINKEVER